MPHSEYRDEISHHPSPFHLGYESSLLHVYPCATYPLVTEQPSRRSGRLSWYHGACVPVSLGVAWCCITVPVPLTSLHLTTQTLPHLTPAQGEGTRYDTLFLRETTFTQLLQNIYSRESEGRERNINVRETSMCCLPQTPQPGTEPTTQSRGLTQNWTHNLFSEGMMLQPTEPHRPGLTQLFL